jgi:ribonuclease Z
MKTAKNPYGRRPGGGISLPDYYRPTPSVANRNYYPPGMETLGPDEMRISFPGSTPWPPTREQSGTCIMVELGTGTPIPKRFFFDLGSGSIKNILAMQVHPIFINDIFISHLHVDHYADLPYMLPFTAFSGRWHPLRVYGPSGRRPELGTRYMIEQMKKMLVWHLENFDSIPIGDGYEIEVTEFDWKDENGVCYDRDGVTVRHWPRSHVKDGASAYRLDWHGPGLSFCWSGDGRPDSLTARYARGVDVFVSEGQLDTMWLQAMKFGAPQEILEYIVDTYHTPYYAAGYLMKEIQPRLGMITHIEQSNELISEAVAEIRSNWDGLFIFGYPDVMVVNVTKEAIWARMAALPEAASVSPPDFSALFPPDRIPEKVQIPTPKLPREMQQEQFLRDMEIDPAKYYPPDADRPLTQVWPKEGISIDVREMIKARGGQREKKKAAK